MAQPREFSHVIAFDDFPFPRDHRGKVPVVGVIFAGLRLEGVVSGRVRRDGSDSTRELTRLVGETKFRDQLQLVMLQGIALAGFNVIDLEDLSDAIRLPVLVVSRKKPRLDRVRRSLLERVPAGRRKWELIEKLGPMESAAGLYVQRMGLSLKDATRAIEKLSVNSKIPEPLRTAHLIAGGLGAGESTGRP